MAQMIRVTGSIYVEDFSPDDLDLGHVMGVSSDFYTKNANGMELITTDGQTFELTDIDFELVTE